MLARRGLIAAHCPRGPGEVTVHPFPKRLASSVLLLCTALTAPVLAGALANNTPAASWTLMFYLDADNDLERPLIKNLEDMLKVGSSDAVNIIVLAARHPRGDRKYSNDAVANLPNWTTTKLLRVEHNKLQEIADWGETDMGNPATLARFLKGATEGFPAQRYGLIIGDHGMAWAGVAVDESSDDDSLSVDELAGAIAGVTKTTGRFELLGFDACVMGNLEVAKTLAPAARYMVASEEIEPADGWDYEPLLAALTRTPTMDGAALGRVIVDTYHNYYLKSPQRALQQKAKALTLAVIDLDKVAPISAAVASLANGADSLLTRAGHGGWIQVAQARNQAEEFGRSAAPGPAPPGSEVYDLVHFAQNIKEQSQDKASAAAADAVIAAVSQAVVYNIHSAARPHANGLSIFFPPDQTTLNVRGKASYNEIGFAGGNRWFPFLQSYTAFPASDQERNRPKPALRSLAPSGRMAGHGSSVKIGTQVYPDEIEEANFVLARSVNGERVVLGAVPIDLDAAGDLKEDWDGKWFTITDQDNELLAPITSFEDIVDGNDDDVYWAAVPAQLRLNGTNEWLDVTLNFELEFKGDDDSDDDEVRGDFIYAVEYTRHGPREIELDQGDELRPVYVIVDAAGNERPSHAEGADQVLRITDADDLKVGRNDVPPGTYLAGFIVSDLEGRQSESLTEVEVPEAPAESDGP